MEPLPELGGEIVARTGQDRGPIGRYGACPKCPWAPAPKADGRRPLFGNRRPPDLTQCRVDPALLQDRHAAAILRQADSSLSGDLRPLLAIADGLDAVRIDAVRHEIVAHRVRAPFAERQVVFARAALVAVTLDSDGVVAILAEPRRLAVQGILCIGTDLIAVVIEEDAIADVNLKILDRAREPPVRAVPPECWNRWSPAPCPKRKPASSRAAAIKATIFNFICLPLTPLWRNL